MHRQKRSPFLLLYLFTGILCPLAVGGLMMVSHVSQVMFFREPKALADSPASKAVVSPEIDPQKKTAVIVLSSSGVEVTDFLAPYEILSVSGAFNVVTASPKKTLVGTTQGLAFIPHTDLDHAPDADLIVVPALMIPNDPAVIQWLKKRAKRARFILGICEGARVLAEANLLRDQATTHWLALKDMRKSRPQIQWLDDSRVVGGGKTITTAGITGAIDGSLLAVQLLAGRDAAQKAKAALDLPSGFLSPDPRHDTSALGALDFVSILLTGAYHWPRYDVGVWIAPGVSELALAAALEVFPRTFAARVVPIGDRREIILTKHGMAVIPAVAANEAPSVNLLIQPGNPPSSTTTLTYLDNQSLSVDLSAIASGKAFRAMLDIVEARLGAYYADLSSKLIEYPSRHKDKEKARFPADLLLRPLGLSALGLGLAHLIRRRIERRAARIASK